MICQRQPVRWDVPLPRIQSSKSDPWSPFPPRRARPGPGPHSGGVGRHVWQCTAIGKILFESKPITDTFRIPTRQIYSKFDEYGGSRQQNLCVWIDLSEMLGLQGYLAHKKPRPSRNLQWGLCPGPYGGPRGAVSYVRGTPVAVEWQGRSRSRRPLTISHTTPLSVQIPHSSILLPLPSQHTNVDTRVPRS